MESLPAPNQRNTIFIFFSLRYVYQVNYLLKVPRINILKTFQNTNNFKGIIYVFLKHTTLASVTTSAPGLQTAFDGARERTVFDGTSKRSPSPRRGVLSLCYFSAIPGRVSGSTTNMNWSAPHSS